MAQDGSWHLEKWARAENGKKHNLPALGVRDGCPRRFYFLRLARTGPHRREIAKYGYFRPLWPRTALGTERNPGAGRKTEKCNFGVLVALLFFFWGGGSRRPKTFSMKVRTFLAFYVLASRTPTGGKLRTAGVLGHLGLGRPLALGEILGGKQKNTNSLIETKKRGNTPPSARS